MALAQNARLVSNGYGVRPMSQIPERRCNLALCPFHAESAQVGELPFKTGLHAEVDIAGSQDEISKQGRGESRLSKNSWSSC